MNFIGEKYLKRGEKLVAKEQNDFYPFTESTSAVHDTVNGVVDTEERYQYQRRLGPFPVAMNKSISPPSSFLFAFLSARKRVFRVMRVTLMKELLFDRITSRKLL